MSLALIFSGQGHQHAAMLPWLEEDALTQALCERLGVADWRAAMADPAWARKNRNAQLLITATALAAWRQLADELPEPLGIAGYSVGELAAFSAAGVLAPADAIALAAQRAELMDEAGRATPGGLMGVTGIGREALSSLLRATPLAIAISNGEDRVVLGGPQRALDEFEPLAGRHGARCTRLAVDVASHTAAMQPAADGFAERLREVALNAPRWPLFSNAADRIWRGDAARDALARQIASTVRWDDCMDQLAMRAPRCVLEIGGGQALASLWNQRHPDIPARSCDEFRTRPGLSRWVAQCCSA
jgi:[acyl-carrier-protein] S-malonyltransferase